jgi:hypothetical protein
LASSAIHSWTISFEIKVCISTNGWLSYLVIGRS